MGLAILTRCKMPWMKRNSSWCWPFYPKHLTTRLFNKEMLKTRIWCTFWPKIQMVANLPISSASTTLLRAEALSAWKGITLTTIRFIMLCRVTALNCAKSWSKKESTSIKSTIRDTHHCHYCLKARNKDMISRLILSQIMWKNICSPY